MKDKIINTLLIYDLEELFEGMNKNGFEFYSSFQFGNDIYIVFKESSDY